MMNERIEELALDAGLLNYVDNETPRRCFIHGHADLEEVEKFAELMIRECAEVARQYLLENGGRSYLIHQKIQKHFGIE
jgi:hypothetical protein